MNLTEHFTLEELTYTSNPQFRDVNRFITDSQEVKLRVLAMLLEEVRCLINSPLRVTSGYRCDKLNKAIGSTDRSQHLLCEAADFVPMGEDLMGSFRTLCRAVSSGDLNVGQLIYETAQRGYGETSWIHISMGQPFRIKEKCNQILTMTDGKYTMLEVVV